MLERFFAFIKDLPGTSDKRRLPLEEDPRVAATALLFQVLDADGARDPKELDRLKTRLSETYNISGAALEQLLREGEQAEQEAIDLYAFTSVLKRHLDNDGRKAFIALMWDVVYADGELHELEDNIVWRVAELLGVDDRDRVNMRLAAQERSAGEE